MSQKQADILALESFRETGDYARLAEVLPRQWRLLPEFEYDTIRLRLFAAELAGRAHRLEEMRTALAPYLTRLDRVPFGLASRTLLICSVYCYLRKELAQALKLATEAETVAHARDDEAAEAEAVAFQAQILAHMERSDEAVERFQKSISCWSCHTQPHKVGMAHLGLGIVLSRVGEIEEAHIVLDRSARLLSKSHDDCSLAFARFHLAYALNALGEPETAYQDLLLAYETFSRKNHEAQGATLNAMAVTLITLKEYTKADELLHRALHKTANTLHLAETYEVKARLHFARRECREAEAAITAALQAADLLPKVAAEARRTLGKLRLAQKQYEAAATLLREALHMAQDAREWLLEVELKALLAQALSEGEPLEAFRIMAEVEATLEGRNLVDLKRLAQASRRCLKALEQEHCFVLSDAKLPHLCEAREEMLKWLWARSLFKSKGNSAKAANLLGVTPTYIRKLTKTIPRHLANAKKSQKA